MLAGAGRIGFLARMEFIRLRGVRQNNLKNFDLDIPVGKLVVVTGLSGAGKSSLVFDTLHAEGQRRYVETFSPYVRQFLDLMPPPKLDSAENIRPSIAVRQTNGVKTTRSTVGTLTELCDHLKTWFAHRAVLHDPATGAPLHRLHADGIVADILKKHAGETVLVAFAVVKPEKVTVAEALAPFAAQGYARVVIDGKVLRIDEVDAAGDTRVGAPLRGARAGAPKDAGRLGEAPLPKDLPPSEILVIQDRLRADKTEKGRVREAVVAALHTGMGRIRLLDADGAPLAVYAEGLVSPVTGVKYREAAPAMFSFNSPVGACDSCKGFGRVIGLDWKKIMPDESLAIEDALFVPFRGGVYGESQKDLLKACKKHGVPVDVPWTKLSQKHQNFVIEGESGYGEGGREWPAAWYGVKRFFTWLESNAYKMHVRVMLSRFRDYHECPACHGARLKPESLLWRWHGKNLPELYTLPASELRALLAEEPPAKNSRHPADHALAQALARLGYLDEVGLGFLAADRLSKTLSGGEMQRVGLTACLGAALADTLFVLDEPSVGLHPRDLAKLVSVLRRLADLGNTVVVVEHDEAVMRAADWLIEIGPRPGKHGGEVVFSGPPDALADTKSKADGLIRSAHPCLTAEWLSGKRFLATPATRRPVDKKTPSVRIEGATLNNLKNLSVALPLGRFVALCGVSGSGKSSLLHGVLGKATVGSELARVSPDASDDEDASKLAPYGEATPFKLTFDSTPSEIVLVDQSPVTRTPRSNTALYSGVWDTIREKLASTPEAENAGLTASHFSFNAGDGRCPHCKGSGWELVEMQFLADVYVPCPVCEGRRFRESILAHTYRGKSVADILDTTVSEACELFSDTPSVAGPLASLEAVGLGYLTLGQPLNTLSGGEAQRLKLVRHLGSTDNKKVGKALRADRADAKVSKKSGKTKAAGTSDAGAFGENAPPKAGALLLLDEPTTGLHREDVVKLLVVLQKLVDAGHGLVVVEHNLDVLKSADWLVELGPDGGPLGGRIVAQGTPESVAKLKTVTAPFLADVLSPSSHKSISSPATNKTNRTNKAELTAPAAGLISLRGAREHNLKNISLDIRRRELTVLTGVSGSGKSSLAFDIIFAEGQRRFMECLSAYARQFVEQMAKPDIDGISGLPPTVAVEQRESRGSNKSTVATVTETAQYLRLLYAKIGVPHAPKSGRALVTGTLDMAIARMKSAVAASKSGVLLLAPLVRARKGHHRPLADAMAKRGFTRLRCDGVLLDCEKFAGLDRYSEHDVEVVVGEWNAGEFIPEGPAKTERAALELALTLASGVALLATTKGKNIEHLSTRRVDPDTGEAFADLDPKHFSWNSPKGWCPACRGHGKEVERFAGEEAESILENAISDRIGDKVCPVCSGERLNPVARAVKLYPAKGDAVSLPVLLRKQPGDVAEFMKHLQLDARAKVVAAPVIPEIQSRLSFLENVGLGYLSLDRAADTLSGGEARRIRLAAQLGSNLAGALYVLDEPSIGLHSRDNLKLIASLRELRDRGNTVLVVEHDEDTLRAADRLIDLGPAAGIHGGHIIADGTPAEVAGTAGSITALHLREPMKHPLRGARRPVAGDGGSTKVASKKAAAKSSSSQLPTPNFLRLTNARLRNLRGFDLSIPLGRLTVIGGVSGAGKSTLISDLLAPVVVHAVSKKVARFTGAEAAKAKLVSLGDGSQAFDALTGADAIRQVVVVDQSPIGKTPRSTPATYMGAFDLIREMLANAPDAKMRGHNAGFFSFNTAGGRCETCGGAGRVKLEMNFMPDTYVPCEDCGGSRYGPAVRDIRWNGKNAAEILALSFEEAEKFFHAHARLQALCALMVQTGLGYLTLGQSSPTLSGGEAQRLKLATELAKGLPGWAERMGRVSLLKNLYILEEPTVGLHQADCEKLIGLLHALVDQGHTVVVVEHHLDVLAEADWLVEIGPDGGVAGGELLYAGAPEGLLKVKRSPTAPFLKLIRGMKE